MHIAQNWRLNAQRYSLKGVKCEKSGHVQFPPREICPHCQQEEARQLETLQSETAERFTFARSNAVQPNEVSLAAR